MKLTVVRTQFGTDATNGLLFIDGLFVKAKTNRSNKSGDKKTDGKSGKPRESTTEKGNKAKT